MSLELRRSQQPGGLPVLLARSGLATSAAVNDVAGHLIQKQLRHKKFDTTSGYIQAADLHRKNAAAGVGL